MVVAYLYEQTGNCGVIHVGCVTVAVILSRDYNLPSCRNAPQDYANNDMLSIAYFWIILRATHHPNYLINITITVIAKFEKSLLKKDFRLKIYLKYLLKSKIPT